jgi:hypothetical protein
MSQPITTFCIYDYRGFTACWRAFVRIGLRVPVGTGGATWIKLLGHGGGQGFSIKPNWGRYALMAIWPDADTAKLAFATNPWLKTLTNESISAQIWYLTAVRSHGFWEGEDPFLPQYATPETLPTDERVAVLTRATIRFSRLKAFWSKVAPVSASILDAEGLIQAGGVGELPIVQQATFSIWQNEKSMMDYAYRSKLHAEVVRLTRQEGWYSEELFARFRVLGEEKLG